jgi:4-hydroxy-tetrahydrodipicolinate synthase
MTEAIRGCWAAVPTPLDPQGLVDGARLAAHAGQMIDSGCDGVVLFGTTGEGPSFSAAERLLSVEALLRHGIPTHRIGLGVGAPAIPDAIALTRAALELGLVHVLALPPFFFRDVSEDGIEEGFCHLVEGVGDARLRLTLYHIPQVSGVPVPARVAARLRARYGTIIAGLKDSSARFADFQAFRAAAPELAITVGSEADINRAVAAGGAGTICGLVNIAPASVRAMFENAGAETEMRRIVDLIDGPFVPTLKAVLAAQTGEDGWRRVRPPLRAASAATGERILQELGTS